MHSQHAVSRVEANSELLARVLEKTIPNAKNTEEPKNVVVNRRKPKQPKTKATMKYGTARSTSKAKVCKVHEEAQDRHPAELRSEGSKTAPSRTTKTTKNFKGTQKECSNLARDEVPKSPRDPENAQESRITQSLPVYAMYHLKLSDADTVDLKSAYTADPEFAKILKNPTLPYRLEQGIIKRNNHACIPRGRFRDEILHDHHDIPSKGHMGLRKTTKDIVSKYYWKTMRKDIKDYVQSCDECQRFKSSTQSPIGLLQPLQPPSRPWQSISMDFITPLPLTPKGNNGLLVVVDRLSKMIRLAPTKPDTSAIRVAELFYDNVYRNFGLPSDVICDRDRPDLYVQVLARPA